MRPAAEVLKLRGQGEKASAEIGKPYRKKLTALRQEVHVPMDFSVGTVTVRLLVSGKEVWQLSVNLPGDSVRSGDTSFPLPQFPWPHPALHIFLDGSVIESFIGGREAMTSRVYSLGPGDTELEVSVGGKGHIAVESWELQPISPDRLTT